MLSGVSQLLFSDAESHVDKGPSTDSELLVSAQSLFGQAQVHQATASNYRIGQTVKTVGSVSSSSASSGQSNLSKVRQIQAQRQQKREEAKQIETNIRICATLWQLHDGKLTPVCIE